MKSNNPSVIALFISLIIVVVFSVAFVVTDLLIYGKVDWYVLIISAIVCLVAGFFVIWMSLERFIYRRIKLVYKTIRKNELPSGAEETKVEKNWYESLDSEVRVWAESQQQEIEELKELEVYRREYIGNISHELRTPIFNIQGYLLTLLDGGLEDQSVNKQYLQRAEVSVNRMIDIINDLEIITRLESESVKLEISRFDISDLAQEVIQMHELSAAEKKIRIFIDTEEQTHVRGDKERMRQVLSNLVGNSIKYGHEGGQTRLSFFGMDDHVLIEVTDNGIGIPEDELPRVFERFYRTSKARNIEKQGTGLGLSIVKHIIEAHKQTITVRSTSGIGTTFAFTLKKG